jgi:hypothetical protein
MQRALGALLAAAVLAAGCAATFDFRREELFEDSAKTYANLMRWSDFEKARRFIGPDAAAPGAALPQNVRVADYQVKQTAYSEGYRRAALSVEISYYRANDPRLRTLMDQQLWEFDADKGRWFNKSGFPKF